MTLPNAERAIIDIRKLRDYCLNPLHDEGQHKARLFVTILGMTADDAEALRDLLLVQPGRNNTPIRHGAVSAHRSIERVWPS
jgi:hypothetical protein